MNKIKLVSLYCRIFLFTSFFYFSCSSEDNTLAPYTENPILSDINVEDATFKPKITWHGGYVSTFGINKGDKAALDSTLVWLIHSGSASDDIKFPLKYGELQPGVINLTVPLGGTQLDSLIEDETFTFWILKEEAWASVSSNPGKYLVADSSINSAALVRGDTLLIHPLYFSNLVKPLNVYINIIDLKYFGPLADINVESTTLNIPKISWEIKTPGGDTLIAAVGISKGTQYDISSSIWEVYSERDSSGTKIYGRDNVIPGPVLVGDAFPNTRTFVEFTVQGGLERNTDYYVWIADKTWDKENRQRFTPGYSYSTFRIQ